jgi:hypothetical protein
MQVATPPMARTLFLITPPTDPGGGPSVSAAMGQGQRKVDLRSRVYVEIGPNASAKFEPMAAWSRELKPTRPLVIRKRVA